MGFLAQIRSAFSRQRTPAQPLTADEEEARRQADLIERNVRERGPGRWRKVSTFRRRD